MFQLHGLLTLNMVAFGCFQLLQTLSNKTFYKPFLKNTSKAIFFGFSEKWKCFYFFSLKRIFCHNKFHHVKLDTFWWKQVNYAILYTTQKTTEYSTGYFCVRAVHCITEVSGAIFGSLSHCVISLHQDVHIFYKSSLTSPRHLSPIGRPFQE